MKMAAYSRRACISTRLGARAREVGAQPALAQHRGGQELVDLVVLGHQHERPVLGDGVLAATGNRQRGGTVPAARATSQITLYRSDWRAGFIR